MARIYRAVNGKKTEKFLAELDGVQLDLEERTFEMAVRAEEDLIEHRADGDAYIEVQHGDIDWYVVLNDERGQKAALSIEFGRAGYIDPETGETYGEMDGLFILTNATHISKKSGRRVPKERKRRTRDGRST